MILMHLCHPLILFLTHHLSPLTPRSSFLILHSSLFTLSWLLFALPAGDAKDYPPHIVNAVALRSWVSHQSPHHTTPHCHHTVTATTPVTHSLLPSYHLILLLISLALPCLLMLSYLTDTASTA